MKLLLRVNQAAALRRGINAPASTVELDINPTALTQLERDVLAAVLIDGHDATRLGIQSVPDDIVGQKWSGSTFYSDGDPTKPLVLERPDVEGLKEAIRRVLAERDEIRAKHAEVVKVKQVEAREKLAQEMAKPPYHNTIWLRADGRETTCDSEKLVKVSYLERECYVGLYFALSAEDRAQYEAWRAECQAETSRAKEAAIASVMPELNRLVEKMKAEVEAKAKAEAEAKAKAQAERAAMMARMPDVFRRRIEAGYSSAEEVDLEIRRMILADAQLPHDGYKVSRELNTLTDKEFTALEKVRADIAKRLPHATVEPMEVADKFESFRPATAADDPADVDDDGEVWEEAKNLRRRIVVSWPVAGLTVRAAQPFPA